MILIALILHRNLTLLILNLST